MKSRSRGSDAPLKQTGRPAFAPTAVQRRQVRAAVKAGLQRKDIAALLGISQPTLRSAFAKELGPSPVQIFQPTPAQRRRVSIAAGGGMSRRDIALGLGISVKVLTTHFRAELTAGALQRRIEVLDAMHSAAKKGNVSAQRAYLSTVLASDEAAPSRRPAQASPGAPPKGKKVQAAEDAQNATLGTDWDDLLPPSGAIIQ